MLVDLGFYLVGAHGVDLADLGAAGDALAQDYVQQAQFTVDGRLHDEVGFALADHLHVQLHVVQGLFHPVDLGAAVQAVLPGALGHQLIFLPGEFVVFLGLQILFFGDKFIFIEGLLLLVGTAQAFHLRAVLQHILAHVQFLLLHLDLRVAQDILLLREFGLGVQDGEVQVVVGEDQDGISGLDLGTFLDEDGLYDAAFLRAQLDGRHRLHAPADADIVIELTLHGTRHRDRILVHPERLVIRPGNQIHDERQQQGTQPIRKRFLRKRHAPSGLFLNDLVHIIDQYILLRYNTLPPPA